jgi:hypothetical protein
MTTNSITLTSEEIAEYRDKFAGLDDALYAIEIIEASDGDLTNAMNLLAQEYNISITKSHPILDDLAQKLRDTICDETFIDDLMTGLLTVAVGSLTATGQIPQAIATPVVIYLTKKGVKTWCNSNSSDANNQ